MSSGIIGVHFGSKLGIKLGAPVKGPGSRVVPDVRNNIKRYCPHVKQHPRYVEQRSKEENPLTAKQNR